VDRLRGDDRCGSRRARRLDRTGSTGLRARRDGLRPRRSRGCGHRSRCRSRCRSRHRGGRCRCGSRHRRGRSRHRSRCNRGSRSRCNRGSRSRCNRGSRSQCNRGSRSRCNRGSRSQCNRGSRSWCNRGSRGRLRDRCSRLHGVRSRWGRGRRAHRARRGHRSRCRCRSRSRNLRVGGLRRIDDHARARARVRTTRRKERRRVDVSLVLVGMTNTELHVGAAHLGIATRADRPDAVAFCDRRALAQGDRPELRERHRPAVGRQDRERPSAPRHRSGERHRASGGRSDRLSRSAADVDSAVLSPRVGTRGIERVSEQNRSARRPRPGAGRGRERERSNENE
jgi:hypothetical protein